MSVDIKRLKRVLESVLTEFAEWDNELGELKEDQEQVIYDVIELANIIGAHSAKPRPTKTEWVDGLPPDSIAEFRKALALNLQNSIEAITGEAFGDDDSLILAHEMMVKYDISDKLKYTGD
jgi:hypothetical protein